MSCGTMCNMHDCNICTWRAPQYSAETAMVAGIWDAQGPLLVAAQAAGAEFPLVHSCPDAEFEGLRYPTRGCIRQLLQLACFLAGSGECCTGCMVPLAPARDEFTGAPARQVA